MQTVLGFHLSIRSTMKKLGKNLKGLCDANEELASQYLFILLQSFQTSKVYYYFSCLEEKELPWPEYICRKTTEKKIADVYFLGAFIAGLGAEWSW